MQSIVYEAYSKYLVYKQKVRDEEYRQRRKNDDNRERGNLWPSDLGKCHLAAMLRVKRTPGEEEFSTRSLDYMNTGVYTEEETLAALKYVYGDELVDQVVLKWEMWSGKADFGLGIGTEKAVIIEHKTTSEKHFAADTTTALPKHDHVGQAMSYMFLHEKMYGFTPEVRLFYKTWGNFAEFSLERNGDEIVITSYINGVIGLKTYQYDVYAEMEELMNWYDKEELPPKLEKKYKGCSFMGRPSCKFYNHCWGEDECQT